MSSRSMPLDLFDDVPRGQYEWLTVRILGGLLLHCGHCKAAQHYPSGATPIEIREYLEAHRDCPIQEGASE